MLIKSVLIHANGKELGRKGVPEDCKALHYGGSTFIHVGDEGDVRVYLMTDTYHFNSLDEG